MPIDPQGIQWDAPPQTVGQPVTGAADRPLRGGVIITDTGKVAAEQRAAAGEQRAQVSQQMEAERLRIAQGAADRAQAEWNATHNPDGSPKAPAEADAQPYSQSAIDAFDRAIASAERLKTHPGFGAAVGSGFDPQAWGKFNPVTGQAIAGTSARDFGAELDAMKAQVFLPMVQSMKGLGALSNAEGQKLTDAIGALDPGMSEAAFRASIDRIQSDLRAYRDRGAKVGAETAAAAPTQTPDMQLAQGETYSTADDIAQAQRMQGAWRGGATIEQLKAMMRPGESMTPEDEARLQADANRMLPFAPASSGRRGDIGQAIGSVAASPVGSYAAGATNALTAGAMDELAPLIGLSSEQVQAAKEYLAQRNPKSSFLGEATGGVLAMAPIGRALGAAGMGARGAALAGDISYGAAYGAGESNENRLMGGLVGGAVGGATGAVARRFLPGGGTPQGVSASMDNIAAGGLPEAEQAGIRVLTSDVRPPESFVGKIAQRTGERIPLAGTGGIRATQQAERTQAVKDVLQDFGGIDATELPDVVMRDLSATRSAELSKFSGMKSEVINRLGQTGEVVPVENAHAQIANEIVRLERIDPVGFRPVINKLTQWGNAIEDKTLNDIEVLRKQIGEEFKAPELANVRGEAESALSRIYGPLRQDMGDFIKANGESADFNKWMIANKRLSEMSGELKAGALKSVLRTGDATPEVVERMLFSAKPSEVRALYRNLSPAGRTAAQGAVMARALKNMGGNLDQVSPEKFLTQMEKLGAQTGILFGGDDAARINGLVKALKLTSRAGEAGVVAKTGQEGAMFAAGSLVQSIFGAMALPATAVAGLMARAYESKAVRNMLLNYGRAKPGSEAESALAGRVANALRSIATTSAVQGVADTTPQQPAGAISLKIGAQ